MRTFQFSDAKSHKFWNIDVSGTTLTVTYGKVGTAGQTQTKTFPTPEKAQAEADKLVKEKTGKGYKETTPTAGPTDEAAALEKAIAANPDDLAAWSALADLLIERGDPRGEFMRVQIALEDESAPKAKREALRKQEQAILKEHEREWLGGLAAFALDAKKKEDRRGKRTGAPVEYRFTRGWLTDLHFSDLSVNQARALAKNPGARLLRRLVVERCAYEAPVGSTEQYIDSYYEPGPDVPAGVAPYDDPGLYPLCRCPHLGTVRAFQLGEPVTKPDGTHEQYFNCHTSGRQAYHLVKQMPHAEELYLHAHEVDGKKLFALPMPNLRVLQVYHSKDYAFDKLAANKSLGNLTHLLCFAHAPDAGDDDMRPYIRLKQLTAVCRATTLPNLTHLRLRLTDFGDRGVKEIVSSGILKRLKVLDLDHGCVTDEGAKVLAACPDLKHLEFLDLSANAMTKDGIAALKKTGVKFEARNQHGQVPSADADDELPEYLFEGDIE